MNNTLTALIVDDSETMRLVLGVTLRDAGIKVVEATDGDEALRYASEQRFDFIITDLNMPQMHGLDLIKQLRAMDNYKQTPILSLTNLNSDKLKQDLKSAGATGCVQKPFGPASLIKTIERLAA